jgi:hypothetical protein
MTIRQARKVMKRHDAAIEWLSQDGRLLAVNSRCLAAIARARVATIRRALKRTGFGFVPRLL